MSGRPRRIRVEAQQVGPAAWVARADRCDPHPGQPAPTRARAEVLAVKRALERCAHAVELAGCLSALPPAIRDAFEFAGDEPADEGLAERASAAWEKRRVRL